MEKQAATNLVTSTLTNPFDENRFANLTKNLLNNVDSSNTFEYQGDHIPNLYQEHIKKCRRICTYTDPEGDELDVLVIHLVRETALERARNIQRNFIAWYLEHMAEKEAALVAYHTDDLDMWRFSSVYMDYVTQIDESGKVKVRKEFTPARRYSYLVGTNESSHTAQSQLLPLLLEDSKSPKLTDIEKSFSVEVVTKEFYEKYRNLFIKMKKSLDNIINKDPRIKKDFDAKGVNTVDFAKKLLGQIVFLYFLQKKGWLGVAEGADWGKGDKRFLRTLFEKCEKENKNFFNDYLEYLFYDALNRENRGSVDSSYYQRFECKIPFLNGGLFDSDYDWDKTEIVVPNGLFSNKKNNSSEGTGILDVFDLYNFTVNEDEPLEKEVAIDPEMLGEVFEKLCGVISENFNDWVKAINSGNRSEEMKFNRKHGVYYTPRVIVHYMCQESIINYLDTTVNISKTPLIPTKPSQTKLSGELAPVQTTLGTSEKEVLLPREDIEAFVYNGEYTVEHDNQVYSLPESIIKYAQLLDDRLAEITICDPAIGSGAFPIGMMHEIVKARQILNKCLGYSPERINYNFKRHCIQECLYGADIDHGAAEIAKLRLWLSLVVDEEDIKQIKPLPNLDFKIVCGNSLLSYPYEPRGLAKVEDLKKQFFDEVNPKMKDQLREQIGNAIHDLYKNTEKILGYHVDFDFKINFSEVFRGNGGFDVVIANPPYDVLNITEGHKISPQDLIALREIPLYQIALGGKLNSFRLFLARAFDLLKESGVVTFIIPYGFMCDSSSKKIRQFVLEQKQINFIEAFPERDDPNKRLFESAKMSTCIVCAKNEQGEAVFPVRTHYSRRISFEVPTVRLDTNTIKSFDPQNLSIPLMKDSELQIVMKICSNTPVHLSDIGNCYEGEVNLTFHKKYLKKNWSNNMSLVKGAAVQRYRLLEHMSQGEIEFLDYKSFLKNNRGPKSNHHKYRRLIMQGITGVNEKTRLKMTILDENIFCGNSVNYILLRDTNFSLEYLLGILNSSLMNWYFKLFSTNSNVNGYEVNNFPIPTGHQKQLIDLVNSILDITNRKKYSDDPAAISKVKQLDSRIDQIVYQLYGLSSEEIAIVDYDKMEDSNGKKN